MMVVILVFYFKLVQGFFWDQVEQLRIYFLCIWHNQVEDLCAEELLFVFVFLVLGKIKIDG